MCTIELLSEVNWVVWVKCAPLSYLSEVKYAKLSCLSEAKCVPLSCLSRVRCAPLSCLKWRESSCLSEVKCASLSCLSEVKWASLSWVNCSLVYWAFDGKGTVYAMPVWQGCAVRELWWGCQRAMPGMCELWGICLPADWADGPGEMICSNYLYPQEQSVQLVDREYCMIFSLVLGTSWQRSH